MSESIPASVGLFFLRFSGLFLALFHGLRKFQGLLAGDVGFVGRVGELGFPAPVVFAWLAALTEFVGGLLIFIGLGTRIFSIFAAFNMAVAAFLAHRAFEQWLARAGLVTMAPERMEQLGNPELAALFFFVFVALAFTGGGRFSIDHLISRARD